MQSHYITANELHYDVMCRTYSTSKNDYFEMFNHLPHR